MTARRVDVLVVGAGPAGCVAAQRLAARGHSVLLVERTEAPRPKICGEYLCPATVRGLKRLDLLDGLPARARGAIRGMLLVSPGGVEVPTRFPQVGPEAPAMSVSRPDLETHLEQRARGAGARVERGVSVVSLVPSPDAMQVGLTDRRGRTTTVRARVVVGADGRHSVVARRTGLQRRPRGAVRGAVRGVVHAWFDGMQDSDSGEMHFFADGSYLGLDPLADGRWNAGWVTDGAVVAGLARRRGGDAFLRQRVAASPALRRRFEGARQVGGVRYLMPLRVDCRAPVADRVVLVGDAAGFYDPLTGEGIHAAVETADLAASVLHEALEQGRTDARFLGRYARLRRGVMRRKALTHHLLQALLRHPGLMDRLGQGLSQRPERGQDLIGVIGQLVPPTRLLRPRFWLPLLRPPMGAMP